MNKGQYLDIHYKADKDVDQDETVQYINFISALYDFGVVLYIPRVGIDLFMDDYQVFEMSK